MSFFSRKKHAHPPQGSAQVSQPSVAPQPLSTAQPPKQIVKEPSYERCASPPLSPPALTTALHVPRELQPYT